ncbi:ComEA family DNA-binding protein [Elusimicrobiota bacterium]
MDLYRKLILSAAVLIYLTTGAYSARRIALVDINIDGVEKFILVPYINRKLARNIVENRREYGFFNELTDLKRIPAIDEELYSKLRPYFTITLPGDIKTVELYDMLDELQEKESAGLFDVDIEKLEIYASNPLDLNTASMSQFMDLPYMTYELVKKIISKRKELRGFKTIYSIREIVGESIFETIAPFIIVIPSSEVEKFHGDVRFRYGLWPYPVSGSYFNKDDKFHNPQYFYNKTRIYYGNKLETGFVIRKDRNSRQLDYENLKNYFLVKNYLLMRNVLTLDTLILGNYSMDFAQGLFVQPDPFLIRSIPRHPKGLKADAGTHYNENFYGVAGSKRIGQVELNLFYSRKPLIVDHLNDDGSVGTPPTVFYSYFITYMSSQNHYDLFGKLTEDIIGTRIKTELIPNIVLGIGYYREKFDPHIDPTTEDAGQTVYLLSDYYFRGDQVRLATIDLEYSLSNFKLLFDIGRCDYRTFDRTSRNSDEYAGTVPDWYWDSGDAYQVLALLDYQKLKFWVNYHWVDYDYFAFHSSPWLMELGDEYFKRDETGYVLGTKYGNSNASTQLSFKYGRPVVSPRFYSTRTNDLSTWSAQDEYEVYWDNSYKLLRKFTVKYRYTYRIKERTWATGEPTQIMDYLYGEDDSLTVHIPYRTLKNRFEMVHEPSMNLRLKWRLEIVDNAYKELGVNMSGYMTFGEFKYKPSSALTIYTRVTYWDAPKGVSAGAMEYVWPNSLIPFGYYSIYSSADKAYRLYIMPTIKLSAKSKLWMKYELWPKAQGSSENVFKLQYDCSW